MGSYHFRGRFYDFSCSFALEVSERSKMTDPGAQIVVIRRERLNISEDYLNLIQWYSKRSGLEDGRFNIIQR